MLCTSPSSPCTSSQTDDVEFILLGTGTSSTIPHVDCLTAPPGAKRCRTCLSTLHPDGKKNIRSRAQNGELVTIVIDAAVEWFPKYGLRKIDAVLITHAQCGRYRSHRRPEAMNGLDDLRGWTLHGAIQPHVDLYVSLETFQEVPEFNWHIIEDRKPFTIGDTGIVVDPFKVHHGRVFSVAPPVDFTPSPNSVSPASTNPPTPGQPGTPVRAGALTPSSEPVKEIFPYFCFGFTIQHAVTYISDVSHIPEDVWEHIRASLAQAVDIARRMGARKTYLTGFSHEVAHEEYRTILEAVGGRTPPQAERTEMVRRGLETLEEGSPVWVRPAFDGLRVFVSPNGKDVWDSEYHD
ncbi:hypothetical protein C8Q77DRAFT_1151746 [Trametes polyzona]|nr:hypothetical protein C8Q77DRAFT_1151746 [Trametes polyzona]